MQSLPAGRLANTIPRRPQRGHSYHEDVDESARQIDDEPVEIQAETPSEENEPVEGIKPEDKPDVPAFEDDEPTS